jgi:hypothetical protein
LLPEKRTPAALFSQSVTNILGEVKRRHTGDPVILSPNGMIFVAALTGATKVNAPRRESAMAEVRMNENIFAV